MSLIHKVGHVKTNFMEKILIIYSKGLKEISEIKDIKTEGKRKKKKKRRLKIISK